jgi:hypothetical protein
MDRLQPTNKHVDDVLFDRRRYLMMLILMLTDGHQVDHPVITEELRICQSTSFYPPPTVMLLMFVTKSGSLEVWKSRYLTLPFHDMT